MTAGVAGPARHDGSRARDGGAGGGRRARETPPPPPRGQAEPTLYAFKSPGQKRVVLRTQVTVLRAALSHGR